MKRHITQFTLLLIPWPGSLLYPSSLTPSSIFPVTAVGLRVLLDQMWRFQVGCNLWEDYWLCGVFCLHPWFLSLSLKWSPLSKTSSCSSTTPPLSLEKAQIVTPIQPSEIGLWWGIQGFPHIFSPPPVLRDASFFLSPLQVSFFTVTPNIFHDTSLLLPEAIR